MKKQILTTVLTVASASALAQDYGYTYNYQEYQNTYNSQIAQQYEYEQESANYYENTQGIAEYQATAYNNIEPAERPWKLSVTAGVSYNAEYKGAKDSDVEVLVLPLAEYKLDPWQRLYISLDEGAGYAYALTQNLEIGGGLGYRFGRDSSDAAILNGMKDVDSTLTYLAATRYQYNKYHFSVILEKGMDSSNDGFTTQFTAGYKTRLNPKLAIGTEILTTYGDDTYMEQNFGVSASDAQAGRAAYNADAGFFEAKLRVFSDYHIAGPHSLTGMATYSKLLGDAKDSTIVEDDDDISMVVGYTYKF